MFTSVGKELSKESNKEFSNKSYFIFFMTDGCDTCNDEAKLMTAKVGEQLERPEVGIFTKKLFLSFSFTAPFTEPDLS
jgi:hypothetical protein